MPYDPPELPNELNNIHNAMQYNADGEPVVRVHVDGINLEGDVIVSNVTIDNPTSNPVNVTVNSGTVNISDGGNSITVDGTVAITDGGNSITVDGTVAITDGGNSITVDGTVAITDGGNSITVDGNVNANVTGTVNANVTGGNINVSQTTSPWIVSGNVVTQPLLGGNDAFGRLRVSEPYTLGDYKHLYGLDPNFIDYIVNGGNIAFQNNQACARLSTTSNSSSRAVHQTKFYHHYMPGKSQMILASFNFYNAVSNVTKRTGYFDDRNGIFLEQTGDGTLSMVVRSYVTGSPVDVRISQEGGVYGAGDTGWNGDPVDGSGPSGWDLDITKTQLWWCDFQWLGVGSVRCGFVHDGEYILCHTFHHSDNLATVYMSNPNLPVRCEIQNVGTTTGGYFDQICTTVMSEGGYNESGVDWAGGNNGTLRTISSGATVPVFAVRLKNTFRGYDHNRIIARLQNLSVFTTTENIYFKVVKLPDQSALTGNTWVDVDTDSGVQYNVTATAISGGNDILISGYSPAGTANGSGNTTPIDTPSNAKKNYIVQNYDSTDSEIYAVVITNLSSSQSTQVGATVQWREIY
jgi:hypothetical protein